MIPIASPIIGKEEIEAVNSVLRSGVLAQGPKVAELEANFAAYCGTKYALAVNSGTAAIHAALFAAGVEAGDEVITTPFSFIATINPILMVGAKPVLVDIDPQTFNIDPEQVRKAVTKKTKAIIVVHLYGQPCDWQEIEDIAKQNDIRVIEDACQSIGATYLDKQTGSLGDLGCFSLYATKNIMCGEGGIITTNNTEFAKAVKRFRQHGMEGPYNYKHPGYNYRMTDLQAAIAVEQLKKVDSFNKMRAENAQYLSAGLQSVNGLTVPEVAPDRTHVFHQYTLRVTKNFVIDREEFIDRLNKKGIGAGIYYPKPLHLIDHISSHGYKKGGFPEVEKAADEVVSLPVHPNVSKSDLDHMISVIKEINALK